MHQGNAVMIRENRMVNYSDVECGLEGEGIVKEGDAKPGCVEATGQKHGPQIEVGKYAMEEDGKLCRIIINMKHLSISKCNGV